MAGFSNYLEDKILDHVLNGTTYTAPSNVYVSLHTADPGETGASEVAGGSYSRQQASFAAASGGSCSTDAQLNFTSMPAVTVTHVGIWDAASSGNFLFGGALSSSKTLNSGDTFTINSGALTVSLD